MKRLLFFSAAFGMAFSSMVFAPTRSVTGQAMGDVSLVPADQALTRATAETNKAELDRLLDAQFTWINAHGTRLSRANVLKAFPGAANADVPPQMRFYRQTAVVTADHDQFHVLRVWVKRASGWHAVLYQEVQQVEKSEPAAAGSASAECENPCKTIPFEPETQSEKEAISSWQGVMRAMADNNADAYAPLIADEFTATDTHHDRPYTKADRLAQIKKQKLSGARSAPPVLLSAQVFDFGDTVMMIAREQRPNAKAYFNTRMWAKRDGRWQMLFSFNTRIE